MSLLIVLPDRDHKPWVEALERIHPGLEIIIYPEAHDKSKVEYALTWNHPRGLFTNYPNLKVISSIGAGVDHIIKDPSLPKSVIITRVIDDHLQQDMADFVLGLVLDHIRNLSFHKEMELAQEWKPKSYVRPQNVNIGIMGLGILGSYVADTLLKNRFNVCGWTRTRKDAETIDSYCGEKDLDSFLKDSQILICLLPLTPETEGILNKELFEKLPINAYLINVARGEHLAEHDLLEMIDNGHLSGASLDVFHEEPLPIEHPFWKHSKIKITPHIASKTNPVSVAPQIIENYKRMLNNEPLLNIVELDKGY